MRFRLIRGREYSKFFDIRKDVNGKPFLKDGSKYISVTHFDGCTLVVTSKKPIGVDVERIKNINDAMWGYLGIEKKNKLAFFREWTRREAYIKKENLRLGDIANIRVTEKCKTIYLFPFVISLCYD